MGGSILAVMPYGSDVEGVRAALGGQQIDLQIAGSPEEGLRLLSEENNSTTVIVYDADRGQPWREALPRFHQVRPELRVVLLSSSADRQMWLDLFDHGGFDMVVQPLRPAELRAIVRNALNPPRFFCSAA